MEVILFGAPARREAAGAAYVELYTRLWDEDEAMMRERSRELARLGARAGHDATVLELGAVATLRAELPKRVEFGGRSFRIVEHEGELLAHATVCPHWLGPLGEAVVEEGCLRCPWHGYRFDLRTGRSADGRGLRLAPAPRVEVDAATGRVRLRAEG